MSHSSNTIHYISWDGYDFVSTLGDKGAWTHKHGNDPAYTSGYLTYFGDGFQKWKATFDGAKFTHTAQGGESHSSDCIEYISADGYLWNAKPAPDGRLNHTRVKQVVSINDSSWLDHLVSVLKEASEQAGKRVVDLLEEEVESVIKQLVKAAIIALLL